MGRSLNWPRFDSTEMDITDESRVLHSVTTSSASATQALAAELAAVLPKPSLVLLTGPLGAGKTTFVQGMARGLGLKESITSPSFLLMKEHQGLHPLRHLDLFRLKRQEEVLALGLTEDLPQDAVVVVEWADRFPLRLDMPTLEVRMAERDQPNERRLDFYARSFNAEDTARIKNALRAD